MAICQSQPAGLAAFLRPAALSIAAVAFYTARYLSCRKQKLPPAVTDGKVQQALARFFYNEMLKLFF